MIFRWLKHRRYERIIKASLVTDNEWEDAFQRLSLLQRLNEQEKTRLKQLAILFLYYKSLEAIGDLEITPTMCLVLALQACLPILNLGLNWYEGLDWYEGWVSVIIYPGAFSKQQEEQDEFGIVHQNNATLSGESWQRGPVILSWDDTIHPNEKDGRNVVIHEFAHKLDMLNGRANGLPPLHKDMSVQQWAAVFNRAYADFERQLQTHQPIHIDPYAATSPAEFFAVFSEYFFEKPVVIQQHYPEVYELLVRFYRQKPLDQT